MSLDSGPRKMTDAEVLEEVSHRYYDALVFHAENMVAVPAELALAGWPVNPVNLLDRALTAERFDPEPHYESKARIGVCPCPACNPPTQPQGGGSGQ